MTHFFSNPDIFPKFLRFPDEQECILIKSSNNKRCSEYHSLHFPIFKIFLRPKLSKIDFSPFEQGTYYFFPTFDFIIVLILYGVYICYHVDIFVLFGLTREHRGMGIDFATTKKINAILLRTSSTFQKSLICDNHFSFLANFC